MEALEFKIQLKPGEGKTAPAYLLTYNKAFTGHRFIMATGIDVKRSGFEEARPGAALKAFIEIAEKASVDIRKEGKPLTNAILKQRIDLMSDRVLWNQNELSIWQDDKPHTYVIPDGVDIKKLKAAIDQERTKKISNLKKVVDGHLTGDKNELFGFWQAVADGVIKPKNGKKLRNITAINKRQTLKLVKEFNSKLTFASTDMKLFNEFTSWLADEKELEPNSIGKHIKEFKAILHLANKNDMPVNGKFIHWPVTREANEVVALTKGDIEALMKLELDGVKADVRNIFIMACFMGLRIGDFPKLIEKNFVNRNGQEFFDYVQGKTGVSVSVPVFPQLRTFMNKWETWPKMISEQNFRTNLRDICKKAELNDRVVIRIRDGVPDYKKKWEAISPHSARRTFASSMFYGWWSKPLPASFAMRYTGHKTEKSFMLYIGASKADLDKKALEILDLKPVMSAS